MFATFKQTNTDKLIAFNARLVTKIMPGGSAEATLIYSGEDRFESVQGDLQFVTDVLERAEKRTR